MIELPVPPCERDEPTIEDRWESTKPQVRALFRCWGALAGRGRFWFSCCPSVAPTARSQRASQSPRPQADETRNATAQTFNQGFGVRVPDGVPVFAGQGLSVSPDVPCWMGQKLSQPDGANGNDTASSTEVSTGCCPGLLDRVEPLYFSPARQPHRPVKIARGATRGRGGCRRRGPWRRRRAWRSCRGRRGGSGRRRSRWPWSV